jgi:hypothetical protein
VWEKRSERPEREAASADVRGAVGGERSALKAGGRCSRVGGGGNTDSPSEEPKRNGGLEPQETSSPLKGKGVWVWNRQWPRQEV